MTRKIRVLIVDDSALIRQLLTKILSAERDIEVVGSAPDPVVARQMIKDLAPDVLTLDVEMPRMDGLAFLEKIMTLRPMPVLMVSTLTQAGAEPTVRALELGAIDYVAKPMMGLADGIASLGEELIAKVRTAAAARVRPLAPQNSARLSGPSFRASETVVAIGASTGGVEALHQVLRAMPADSPAILVTQHMPPAFTASFARRLDGACAVSVAEARDGARILPGHVYIAPGGLHLQLARSGANYVCSLNDGAAVSGHRPSVDVLFSSFARHAGSGAVGVILTGMGRDGARGLGEMRSAGARTIGQDEESSVVYGMPKVAMAEGAVETEVSLAKMAGEILRQSYEVMPRRIRI